MVGITCTVNRVTRLFLQRKYRFTTRHAICRVCLYFSYFERCDRVICNMLGVSEFPLLLVITSLRVIGHREAQTVFVSLWYKVLWHFYFLESPLSADC